MSKKVTKKELPKTIKIAGKDYEFAVPSFKLSKKIDEISENVNRIFDEEFGISQKLNDLKKIQFKAAKSFNIDPSKLDVKKATEIFKNLQSVDEDLAEQILIESSNYNDALTKARRKFLRNADNVVDLMNTLLKNPEDIEINDENYLDMMEVGGELLDYFFTLENDVGKLSMLSKNV